MNQEHTTILLQNYPILYGRINHFDCGDGWFVLLRDLSDKIEAFNRTADGDQHVVATQVKEKFGGLRFYVDHHCDEVEGPIADAEEKSFEICEECGGVGTLREGNWLRTLCDDCHHKK